MPSDLSIEDDDTPPPTNTTASVTTYGCVSAMSSPTGTGNYVHRLDFERVARERDALRAALKAACDEINEHRVLWHVRVRDAWYTKERSDEVMAATDAAIDLATGEPRT